MKLEKLLQELNYYRGQRAKFDYELRKINDKLDILYSNVVNIKNNETQ